MQAELDGLIDASRGGDRDAFGQVIERYQRAVYAVAFSTVRDRTIADDVTQDAFVVAWRRLGELRDRSRFPAWLCGIARNLARDACKRRKRESGDGGVEAIDATTPFDAMSDVEAEWLIATALGQVPEVYREPLVLYYYEDRSVEDVARALGITAATTNKRLSRGRRYLAERVAVVERGLARRGPPAALAASVIALIGVTVPASHVDASTAKGSTMHKLAIAAAVTAVLGGGTALVVAAATRGSDAHAGTNGPSLPTASASGTATAAAGGPSCDLLAELGKRTKQQQTRHAGVTGSAAPGVMANVPATDCDTVGRHLAELEADMTHGPQKRPDEETSETCGGFYAAQCASEDWSGERRACALAAADLVNAHLCASAPAAAAAESPGALPPALACAALGQHLATVAHGGGMYTDVTDMDAQIAAACELGGWSLELRTCFGAAMSIDAATACVAPLLD
jgi:RNA polymerase sigma factor (sigma-70 family)